MVVDRAGFRSCLDIRNDFSGLLFLTTQVSSARMTLGVCAVHDGLLRIDWMLYSSSISWSAACSGQRRPLVGSGGLSTASRSMAMR